MQQTLRQLSARLTSGGVRLLPLVVLLLLWQLAAIYLDSKTLPTPSSILRVLWQEGTQGELLFHLGMTLKRVGLSFMAAMVLGTLIGILMGMSKTVDHALDTFLIIGLNIPALVVIVICFIWFGLTESAAIAAVTINKIPMVAVSLREGARALDKSLFQVAQVYRLSHYDKATQIILPQLLPYLFGATRNGLAMIWKIVLVVELLGCSNGVGFQIGGFFHFFDISGVLAYTVAFMLVVFSIEVLALRPLEKYLLRWRA
jgi:NitT/TauT family transport system permease protein